MSIRTAQPDEKVVVSRLLGRALQEGTFVGYLTSNSKDPLGALSSYFGVCFDACPIRTITEEGGGAALWEPPGTRNSLWQTLRLIPVISRFDLARLPLCLRSMRAKGSLRPREPHYYLSVLGVVPEQQNRGLGSRLLQHTLHEIDAKRVGAYLETGNPKNIPLYERFGFRVTHEVKLLGAEVPFFTMWRAPSAPSRNLSGAS